MAEIEPLPVMWRGHLVGHIANPQFDHMFVYGAWQPTDDHARKAAFGEVIDQDGEAEVHLGIKRPPLRGIVATVPDKSIEVRLSPTP